MARLLALALCACLFACPASEAPPASPPAADPAPSSAELKATAQELLGQAKRLEDEGAQDPTVMQANLRKAAKLRAEASALMVKAKTRALAE
jgi:hypothetical protein